MLGISMIPDSPEVTNLKSILTDIQESSAGIILIAAEDPLNRLTMAITKQEYSSIGFYCPSTASGRLEILVFVVDVFGTGTPSWLFPGYTLENLLDNNLVTKVAVKKLRPLLKSGSTHIDVDATKKLHTNFRAAIATVMNANSGKESVLEALYQLFGHPVDNPSRSLTAIEMVNRVIMMIGAWDKVPNVHNHNHHHSSKHRLSMEIQPNSEGKVSIISMLGVPFMQQEVKNPSVANKLIQSYIVENALFGNLMQIPLPHRSPAAVELARNEALNVYRPYLIKIFSTFIDELLRNPSFFNTVLRGVNQGLRWEAAEQKIVEDILVGLVDSCVQLSGFLRSSVAKGSVNYSQVQSILESTQESLQKASLIVQIPEKPIHKKNLSAPIQPKKELAEMVNLVIKAIENGETPVMNLNKLITITNSLNDGSYPIVKPYKSKKSYGAVFTTDNILQVPIVLSSGQRIRLPLSGASLGEFNLEQLKEIANFLEETKDSRLDGLRVEVAKRIADLKSRYD